MKKLLPLILSSLTLLLFTTSCHEEPKYIDSPLGTFDALCDIVANRYCFLEEKNINWQNLCKEYRAKVKSNTKQLELFEICSDLLDELKDGHVNLSSGFTTSYYRKWWSDYPQDFNLRTLQEYYLKFDYYQTSGISYKMLTKDIAYMYYPSFSNNIGETSLDYILTLLSKSNGLIIDIRNNGGGALTNIDVLLGRFIEKEMIGGYIRHKLSAAPNDFSKPYPVLYKPSKKPHVNYLGRPIFVLTNRACYSAANDFTAVMKLLPNVTIVGARTGGGGGLPFSSELPNGWAIRFSACPINDGNDQITEFGIDPSPGYEMHSTDAQLAAGQDNILEFALQKMTDKIAKK